MSHLENNYIFGIVASSWLIWLIWKWHSSTFNFDPLITLWGNFDAPYLKLLNDANVASACFYVRTCRRVRNSKKIATIRDFHLPGSFLCLSTRLKGWTKFELQCLLLYLFIPIQNLQSFVKTADFECRYSRTHTKSKPCNIIILPFYQEKVQFLFVCFFSSPKRRLWTWQHNASPKHTCTSLRPFYSCAHFPSPNLHDKVRRRVKSSHVHFWNGIKFCWIERYTWSMKCIGFILFF